MRRNTAGREQDGDGGRGALAILLDMEPELQLLRGLVVLLQAISCQDDAVEPVALAALARLGEEALDRSETCWRQARDAASGRRDA